MGAPAENYDSDYHAWALHNAELLRQGRFQEADIAHIIEELEGMGNSNKHELFSRLKMLLMHLLKWQFQLVRLTDKWAEFDGKSWRKTIIEQRDQIQDVLADNPSLKPLLKESINKAYPAAVRLAVKETNLPKSTFPTACPYTPAQILDDDFYPGGDLKTLIGEHS